MSDSKREKSKEGEKMLCTDKAVARRCGLECRRWAALATSQKPHIKPWINRPALVERVPGDLQGFERRLRPDPSCLFCSARLRVCTSTYARSLEASLEAFGGLRGRERLGRCLQLQLKRQGWRKRTTERHSLRDDNNQQCLTAPYLWPQLQLQWTVVNLNLNLNHQLSVRILRKTQNTMHRTARHVRNRTDICRARRSEMRSARGPELT
jgi:hypothetical protein